MIGQLSGGSLGRIYSTRYSTSSKANGTGKTHSVQEALKSKACLIDKEIQLYPDCFFSIGLGDGAGIHMNYDASSTDADPVLYVWGKKADGSEYQQKIHVNQINPKNATAIEMFALHAHQGTPVFSDEDRAITDAALAFGVDEKMDYAQFIEDYKDMSQKARQSVSGHLDIDRFIQDYKDMSQKAMQKSVLELLDTERYLFEHQHSIRASVSYS